MRTSLTGIRFIFVCLVLHGADVDVFVPGFGLI